MPSPTVCARSLCDSDRLTQAAFGTQRCNAVEWQHRWGYVKSCFRESETVNAQRAVGASQSSVFPYTWTGQRGTDQPIEIVCPQNTWCNLPICQCSADMDDARKLKVGGHVEKLIV